jgi:hypothetical protein
MPEYLMSPKTKNPYETLRGGDILVTDNVWSDVAKS